MFLSGTRLCQPDLMSTRPSIRHSDILTVSERGTSLLNNNNQVCVRAVLAPQRPHKSIPVTSTQNSNKLNYKQCTFSVWSHTENQMCCDQIMILVHNVWHKLQAGSRVTKDCSIEKQNKPLWGPEINVRGHKRINQSLREQKHSSCCPQEQHFLVSPSVIMKQSHSRVLWPNHLPHLFSSAEYVQK